MKFEIINADLLSKDIVSLVFNNRGIKDENIFDYIDCHKDFRTNPFSFVNMNKAVDLLTKHLLLHSTIKILIDADCDGYMSATIMYKLIKELDPEAEVDFIHHEDKKHGVHKENLELIKNMDIDLLIIPDAGSNQIDYLKEIKASGIEVLVIDHHEAQPTNEIVIVNNQYNNVNPELSGGAMVLKFAEAMIGDKADKYRDLAAVSIISDNMAMNNLENRFYVKHGLSNINNDFLKVLVGDPKNANSSEIGFGIAPMINSIVRMGNMTDKTILANALIGKDGYVELPVRKNGKKTNNYSYIDAAIKISKWRREEQKQIVNEEIEKVDLDNNDPINIVVLDKNFNTNLSGYFANVVSGKTLKPTLVVKYDELDDTYKGSARAANVVDFKDYLRETDLFRNLEGHQGAFGIEIRSDSLKQLKERMKTMKLPTEKIYKVDKILHSEEIDKRDITAIHSLENIWGKCLEKPLFAVKLKDASISLIGANLKTMRISKGGITYIKFNCSDQEIEKIQSLKGMVDIDIVGTFDVNIFNGRNNYQIKIEDYEILSKEVQYNPFDCDEDDDFADLF